MVLHLLWLTFSILSSVGPPIEGPHCGVTAWSLIRNASLIWYLKLYNFFETEPDIAYLFIVSNVTVY